MDRTEPAVEWLIRLCGYSAIVFVFGIFFFVFIYAFPMLGKLNWTEFFTSPAWRPTAEPHPQYGILALLVGHARRDRPFDAHGRAVGTRRGGLHLGVLPPRVRETLKVLIELLAAIPSVVWGFIGYMVLGPIIIRLTGAPVGVCLLNGSIILALMSVPIIVSVGEDALKAVPDSYREAALSLGASRWETVYRVLFPAAKNGLLAAVLLGVGRDKQCLHFFLAERIVLAGDDFVDINERRIRRLCCVFCPNCRRCRGLGERSCRSRQCCAE